MALALLLEGKKLRELLLPLGRQRVAKALELLDLRGVQSTRPLKRLLSLACESLGARARQTHRHFLLCHVVCVGHFESLRRLLIAGRERLLMRACQREDLALVGLAHLVHAGFEALLGRPHRRLHKAYAWRRRWHGIGRVRWRWFT